jgi:hypothetical protein
MTEQEVLAEFADVFDGVGRFDGEVHLDTDPTVPPVQMPLRRLPFGVRDKVAEELRRLEKAGIIAPVNEPTKWVSALLVVAKGNNSIRLCLDPKPLNRALRRVPYCMPTLQDILPKLQKVKVMSSVDAKDGFFHCVLDYESSLLTTMETPFGRHRWLRLPFGISVAPEVFEAKLVAEIADLKGIACIADDILILGAGDTESEAIIDHNNNLRALLQRCRERGIRLNKQKMKLNRKSMLYCGHLLECGGYKPDPRKIDAILKMPTPTDKAGVQRLLGMATYLSNFCPGFSEATAALRSLTHRETEFCWRPDPHGTAFQKLKQLMTNPPVLAYFDASKPVTVQSDASRCGLGGVLLQDGHPVEFISRAMTSAEENYAQIEKELLAIVWSLERFDTYVYLNKSVTVETDHKPLLAINRKALGSAPKRLQRMLLRLQRYKVDLVYKPGSQMFLADALSRAYLSESSDSRNGESSTLWEELAEVTENEQMDGLRMVASQQLISQMQQAAADDEEYQLLRKQISEGWPSDMNMDYINPSLKPYATFADELTVSGPFVFKGTRVVVPYGAREEVINRLHSSHMGINGCLRRARETVYFPGISNEIKRAVSQCGVCQRHQAEAAKEPLKPHQTPTRPWQRVGIDIFTHMGHDYIVSVDYLSGYFEIDRLASKRCKDVIYALRQQWARHGIPEQVISDNNPFNSAEFSEFAAKWEFQHITSSPNFAQSNGRAENAVKTAKRLMQKEVEAGTDPLLALLDWRNTPTESSNKAPVEIMFGRRTRTRLPMTDKQLRTAFAQQAQTALIKSKERQAAYYNRGARERDYNHLRAGQTVRVKFSDNDWRKAEIIKCHPNRAFDVRLPDGTTRRRTSRHVRFSSEPRIIDSSLDGSDTEQPSGVRTSNERSSGERPPAPAAVSNELARPPAATQTMTR